MLHDGGLRFSSASTKVFFMPVGMVAVLEGDEGSVRKSHVTSLVQLRLCLGI